MEAFKLNQHWNFQPILALRFYLNEVFCELHNLQFRELLCYVFLFCVVFFFNSTLKSIRHKTQISINFSLFFLKLGMMSYLSKLPAKLNVISSVTRPTRSSLTSLEPQTYHNTKKMKPWCIELLVHIGTVAWCMIQLLLQHVIITSLAKYPFNLGMMSYTYVQIASELLCNNSLLPCLPDQAFTRFEPKPYHNTKSMEHWSIEFLVHVATVAWSSNTRYYSGLSTLTHWEWVSRLDTISQALTPSM